MNVALFDLDGTLLKGDTDVLWGEVLTRHDAFDPKTTDEFKRGYASGELDADDFVARFLSPLAVHGHEDCQRWREELLTDHVFPLLSERVLKALEQHRSNGHELILATATNEFLTQPIAAHLNIPHLLASPAERVDGVFTGKPAGPACFRGGKLRYATEWLASKGETWGSARSWFYSDSINDLPLLEAVHHSVVVDPDPNLAAVARDRGWSVIHR